MLTASFRPPSGGWYSRPSPPMQRRGRSRQISPVALARQASEERRLHLCLEKQRQPDFNFLVSPTTSLLLHLDQVAPSSTCHVDASSFHLPIGNTIQPHSPHKPHSSSRSSSPTSASLDSADSSATPSLSTDSSNSYDSPPDPPQSLEDQLQVAYALDDIRLAKILLLKLKGIHVTSDNDPRIDQVRDEDFDIYFVPSGPLKLEEPERRVVQETQQRQRERWQEAQRKQRLRMCEKIWEEDKQRLHLERLRAIRRREEEMALEEERRRALEIQQHEEAELALQQRSRRVGFSMAHRQTVSYGKLSQARLQRCLSKCDDDPFQYTVMQSIKLPNTPPKRGLPSLTLRGDTTPKPSGSHRRAVSFKEVVSCMDGKLFPLDAAERAEDARRIAGISTLPTPPRHRRQASLRSELLHSLLHVVEWQEGERRKAKGKGVERPAQVLHQSPLSNTPAPILSVPSNDLMLPMSSSVSTSRSNSWLSLGSWRSSVTDITSPEVSSPISDSPKYSASSLQLPTLYEKDHDFIPRSSFVLVPIDETPLSSPKPQRRPLEVRANRPVVNLPPIAGGDSHRLESAGRALVRHVSRSVHGIVDAAKGLQSAYITATMFSVGASPASSSLPQEVLIAKRSIQHHGYRARSTDVKKFTAHTPPLRATSPEPVHFIPLVSPFPVMPSVAPHMHRSVSSHSFLIPSPLRPRTPPTVLAYRMRPVANPEILRLRALQNIMCARGKEWEGRGREGGLGCGKERMLGIAFEGRGPSSLGCEVRFVLA